eukprot:4798083-Pleurochrysis_carterae.AAC.3
MSPPVGCVPACSLVSLSIAAALRRARKDGETASAPGSGRGRCESPGWCGWCGWCGDAAGTRLWKRMACIFGREMGRKSRTVGMESAEERKSGPIGKDEGIRYLGPIRCGQCL